MVHVWKFLAPRSGEHVLKAERLGSPKQLVKLDGTDLPTCQGQTVFPGPGGEVLRLMSDAKAGWILLVNEQAVEQVGTEGDGLRDLRSMPDGSYTIATGFSVLASGGVVDRKNVCRRYKFQVAGKRHLVVLAHKGRTWQVALDGELVSQERHAILESAVHVQFEVLAADGTQVPAELDMTWCLRDFMWHYCLRVNSIKIPPFKGKLRKGSLPGTEVLPQTSAPNPETIHNAQEVDEEGPSDDGEEEAEEAQKVGKDNEEPMSLPQGVSYDREARIYQANIRDPKTGRFVLLGEFFTQDEAHQAYLEAFPRFR